MNAALIAGKLQHLSWTCGLHPTSCRLFHFKARL